MEEEGNSDGAASTETANTTERREGVETFILAARTTGNQVHRTRPLRLTRMLFTPGP
jgi:hypothetical protein